MHAQLMASSSVTLSKPAALDLAQNNPRQFSNDVSMLFHCISQQDKECAGCGKQATLTAEYTQLKVRRWLSHARNYLHL